MQAVELPSSYDIATRGTLPTSPYGGRPSFSSRTNRTPRYATPRTRKGNSPSRGPQSASPQKRAAVKTPSPLGSLGGEEERTGARGSLQQQQPTAKSSTSNNSSSITAVRSVAAGAQYQKIRHNSNSSSKYRQPQQG